MERGKLDRICLLKVVARDEINFPVVIQYYVREWAYNMHKTRYFANCRIHNGEKIIVRQRNVSGKI